MKKTLILAITMLTLVAGKSQSHNDVSLQLQSFSALVDYINEIYVDSVDRKALIEGAMVSMLENLDPHSVYIPAEELAEMNEPLLGNFDGVGIQFNILKDTILVVSPISGGPSEKVGIQAGDRIVEVDGENVAGVGVKNSDVMRLLKGPRGTQVNVGIVRRGDKKPLDFLITRDKIPLYSIDASYMADPTTGYIKINRFAATTIQEFRDALVELKMKGMENLILDLQGNGGGYLRSAIDIADEFLSDDQLIVFTEGRAFPKDETFATSRGGYEKGKLVVLIDEGSASASEIVSGAIQDWDRGMIIGRRSFGKGLVQKPVSLPNGGAVRLTTQEYFTPTGRCIQKPYEDGKEAYQKEKYERLEHGELTDEHMLFVSDSVKYFTKLNNRTVYGGGGIIPDIFVALDTTATSDYYSAVIRKGLMNSFVLEYVNKERKSLTKSYPDVNSFLNGFEFNGKLKEDFFAFATKEEVEYDEEGYTHSKIWFDTRFKALVARNLFDQEAFYEVINPILPAYQRALEVMNDGSFERMNLAQNR
jgi:carboxyl-terminal processing protease